MILCSCSISKLHPTLRIIQRGKLCQFCKLTVAFLDSRHVAFAKAKAGFL